LRQAEYSGLILSHSGASSLVGKIEELHGVYVAAPIIYNPSYQFARQAKDKYEDRFQVPFTHQAAVGYDFMHIFAGLMENKQITRQSIQQRLEAEFSYSGIMGDLEKSSGGHELDFPLFAAKIVDGRISYLH